MGNNNSYWINEIQIKLKHMLFENELAEENSKDLKQPSDIDIWLLSFRNKSDINYILDLLKKLN